MYPKYFRSNPDDARTEIIVHDETQEAAVRETRVYPHEVSHEVVQEAKTAQKVTAKAP